MFERTLTDVVKGIRASKRDTALYISQCIAEIKTEISSNDLYVKANALQKLTFLQMLGYSMSWASFATIEVMSSPRFGQKRIGYLAASQGFTQDTDVILLTTNLLKKELRGAVGGAMHGVYEAGLAINCISNIVTEDLARDLLPEITSLTTHPQPYLRKKAILCLFKVFMKYPQGLRLTFEKLQQALNDPNPSVVSCAVNVITELSDKNPKNYLHLAPAFFELLTGSSNNWMLIKVVKLLGSLVPEEPRLARKLLEPLATIVRTTQAKSLLYEAVLTITLCLPYCRKNDGTMPANVPEIVELCAKTLGSFLEESDQNLKFLGLVGFASLMVSHPKVLSASEYRPLILACLSDQDETIRRRALDLLIGMTTRKNIMELVSQLMKHVQFASGTYRNDLVAKIVELCMAEKYSLLTDFAWYIDVLFQLGHLRGVEVHGELLRFQITDIALRVLPVRAYAVRRSMETLLERDGNATDDPRGDNGRGKNIMPQILPALAWIIGEYSDLIVEGIDMGDKLDVMFDSSSNGAYHSLIQVLTCPIGMQKLPADVLKVYVQASMKVYAAATVDSRVSDTELESSRETIRRNLQSFAQCTAVEVSERSYTALILLSALTDSKVMPTSGTDVFGINSLDSTQLTANDVSRTLNYLLKPSPMKPVGNKAQRKQRAVVTGYSLDIEAPIELSLFGELIAEEESCRSSSTLNIESVCFTQQHPFKHDASHITKASAGLTNVMSVSGPASPTSTPRSFQQDSAADANTSMVSSEALNRQRRRNDPFYLASTSSTSTSNAAGPNSRFGTIQLVDSDDENNGKRKHKKKKDKKSSSQNSGSGIPGYLANEGNLLSFGVGDAADSSEQILIHSSDEDNDDMEASYVKKKSTSKAFSGLARVDLTTPLREDEVMPQQRHRVVPDRKVESKSPSKSNKKPKKAKKAKHDGGGGMVEDLLGLGEFVASPVSALTASSAPPGETRMAPVTTSKDTITHAFDDLLSMTTPSVTRDLSIQPAPSTSHSLSWLRASIKTQNASDNQVGWDHTSIVYRIQGGMEGLSIVFRIENNSTAAIVGLTLSLKGNADVHVGNVAPGSTIETTSIHSLLGPSESSSDIKGHLSTFSGSRVPFKISIPASLSFTPRSGLTLDEMYRELNSTDWASNSSKVDMLSDTPLPKTLASIATFLKAGKVEGSVDTAAAFAATACSGSPVRVLLKLSGRTVKMDVKSTNARLCKDVASDLKRLCL